MPASSTAAGFRARRSTCFPHKDTAAAERKLTELDGQPGRKLLITDGVFSMDGDIGPLPGLVQAAEKHGAIMMVDDAHSSGVLGRNGRGTVDHFGLHGRVHIQVGTLSKAIGVLGGYVCGSRGADRVSVPSRAAVPVFDFASAGRGGCLHGRVRRAGTGAGTHSSSCGTTRAISSRGCARPGSTRESAKRPLRR